jgi:HSP20 family protein
LKLVVRGVKQIEREWTEGRYQVTECAYGRFERAIPLPDEVDSYKVRAN